MRRRALATATLVLCAPLVCPFHLRQVPSSAVFTQSLQRQHQRHCWARRCSSGLDGDTYRELYGERLPQWLIERLEELGFAKPTLVQQRALDTILAGHDAVLHAQTGSGKTLAFLVPLFACIDPSRASVQGLVVVPTRELGLQVAAVAKRLAAATGAATGGRVMVMSVLEGSNNRRQRAWAWAEPPHVVIGNPETLSALVAGGAVRCNGVRYVVVDEVDACLRSGDARAALTALLARHLSPTFAQEEEAEVPQLPGGVAVTGAAAAADGARRRVRARQTVFASATVPQHNHFMRQCVAQQWTLAEPVHVQVHPKEAMPPGLTHHYVTCAPAKKLAALRALVRRELGGDGGGGAAAAPRALVFAQANRPLDQMAAALDADLRKARGGGDGSDGSSAAAAARDGGAAAAAGGGNDAAAAAAPLADVLREDLGLARRADAVARYRAGAARVLLTTDLAARGLDVPETTHVFHFDLPADAEGYIHRGGRAGRLGRAGRVVSIVTPEQEFVLQRLANAVGVEVAQLGKAAGAGTAVVAPAASQ
ncbi:DEAD box helicase [Tribonema minus]|uniref:DEAD box helicase n=1 Tax=Tribonema minus TaxID=303371 RepID=A0A835Z5K4_9STRA|nr:DEAD box helicase [Tribonema minus]